MIIRGLNDQKALPYHAMVAQTIPRLVELSEEMLIDTGESTTQTEIARVKFGEEVLSIPDLDYVESAIREVMDA